MVSEHNPADDQNDVEMTILVAGIGLLLLVLTIFILVAAG
jgi:Na+-transporting methylmalonyl-CoA/oxaloacetate decarboxylase gamma subunit